MNAGKVFEMDFKASVPKDIFCYRLRDGTASFDGGDTRFQGQNICDFICYIKPNLYFLELKSHAGKSIPYDCIVRNKGDKRLYDMVDAERFGINAYYIFNMRDISETWAVTSSKVKDYMDTADRKSIPIDFMREGILIQQKLKRTHYKYDLEFMK